jgi:hypothetical protein
VEFPADLSTLTIGNGAFRQEATGGGNALVSVEFPASLVSLSIGDSAFYQYASGGGNALVSVEFPEGLTELNIGNNAFFQQTGSGDSNALLSVEFPADLSTLTIGNGAFRQEATGGGNALVSVEFPKSLSTLTIGDYAFYQRAGGGNALVSVEFPAGLTELSIGKSAFYQETSGVGGNALGSVEFPNSLVSLSIGDYAFHQRTSGNASNALVGVVVPAGLTSLAIGTYAFDADSLRFVEFTPAIVEGGVVKVMPGEGANSVSLGSNVTGSSGAWWLWGGVTDNGVSTTADKWAAVLTAGSSSYSLYGLRELRYDANDTGVVVPAAQWFIDRDVIPTTNNDELAALYAAPVSDVVSAGGVAGVFVGWDTEPTSGDFYKAGGIVSLPAEGLTLFAQVQAPPTASSASDTIGVMGISKTFTSSTTGVTLTGSVNKDSDVKPGDSAVFTAGSSSSSATVKFSASGLSVGSNAIKVDWKDNLNQVTTVTYTVIVQALPVVPGVVSGSVGVGETVMFDVGLVTPVDSVVVTPEAFNEFVSVSTDGLVTFTAKDLLPDTYVFTLTWFDWLGQSAVSEFTIEVTVPLDNIPTGGRLIQPTPFTTLFGLLLLGFGCLLRTTRTIKRTDCVEPSQSGKTFVSS